MSLERDLQIIDGVKKKSCLTVSGIERKYNIPKNVLHNTRINGVSIPEKHRIKLLNYLMEEDIKPIDDWNKLSAKKVLKHQFPKWIKKLKEYCVLKNITIQELIDTHSRIPHE